MARRLYLVILGLGVDDSREFDLGVLLPRISHLEGKKRGEPVATSNDSIMSIFQSMSAIRRG